MTPLSEEFLRGDLHGFDRGWSFASKWYRFVAAVAFVLGTLLGYAVGAP